MKKIILVISIIIGFFELCVIVAYFCLFHGGISTDTQDWDIFIQIFNGMIMAVLTAVNIYIFYQLTVAIEDRNQKRAIKEKVFEAQSIITNMRIKQYDEVKSIIHKIKIELNDDKVSRESFDDLVNNLEAIKQSFLFKDIDEGKAMCLNCNELMGELAKYCRYKDNKQDLIKGMYNFISTLDIFIVRQLMVGNDVTEYIEKNKDDIDSSFRYIVNYIEKLKRSVLQDISKRKYFDLESLTNEREYLEYVFKTLKTNK